MRPDGGYRAHRGFVEPARARSEVWRLVLGLLIAGFAYVVLSQMYFDGLIAGLGGYGGAGFVSDLRTGATPAAMLALLFNFAFMTVAVAGVVMVLHKRAPVTVLGEVKSFTAQFRGVLVVLVALMAVVTLLPPWGMGTPFGEGLALGVWLGLLPLSLLAVLVQTSAEEILFRGYIQQQLAARYSNPLVWMVLPSALFAMGHYLPDLAGPNALAIALWAGVFGMLMADLTARSGTLGPAIAVHFINNVFAILITSMPDDLYGLALFTIPFTMSDHAAVAAWLPVDFALMFVSWLLVRVVLRR